MQKAKTESNCWVKVHCNIDSDRLRHEGRVSTVMNIYKFHLVKGLFSNIRRAPTRGRGPADKSSLYSARGIPSLFGNLLNRLLQDYKNSLEKPLAWTRV